MVPVRAAHGKVINRVFETLRQEEYSRIIVAGGDGTMNEVVCGIRDYSLVTLGCIPIGSSNDLIRDFDFPKQSFDFVKSFEFFVRLFFQ